MSIDANNKIVRGADLSVVGSQVKSKLLLKQDTLISGTNIKTINGESVLGSGNLNVSTIGPFKGYYSSAASLAAAFPSPQTGDYAYVKNSGTPTTANIYAESSGSWSDTGMEMQISDIESVFTTYAKTVLLSVLQKVAWVDTNGQSYINMLQSALLGSMSVVSITADYDPGSDLILDTLTLDDLRQYLTVTAEFSDGTEEEITGYQISGTISAGSNTIVVSFLDQTDSFTVEAVHNYSGALSTWKLNPENSIATYIDGTIRMKCSNSTDYNNYYVWAADCKRTLWSSVNGKTVLVRIKLNDLSYSATGLGIYENASISSLANSHARRVNLGSSFVLKEDGYYETEFVCDISNFTQGTLTPGSSATFGFFSYSHSQTNYIEIYDAQIIEVDEQSE